MLRQRRSHLLQLQTRWTTPLASSLRFVSRAKDALKTAIALSGGSQLPTAYWLNTTPLVVAEREGELDDVEFTEPQDLLAFESERATLADILEGDADAENVDDFDYVTDTDIVIVWEAPEVRTTILPSFMS